MAKLDAWWRPFAPTSPHTDALSGVDRPHLLGHMVGAPPDAAVDVSSPA